MKARALLLWVLLPLIFSSFAATALPQPLCDARDVQLSNNFIRIEPTGFDDTANMQCALDLAAERNIPQIRLTPGDFYVSTLYVKDFTGTLQGGGADQTRVRLLEASIDCESTGSAITFAGGEPRVRWLSLIWDRSLSPCTPGSGALRSLLHFTGFHDDPTSCSSDVTAASVDRVVLVGPGFSDEFTYGTAIRVEPVHSVSDCRNTLLGSFQLSRSTIDSFPIGVEVRMRGGAIVGIHKNSLVHNGSGLDVRDSGATVTVAGNYFSHTHYATTSACHFAGRGMRVINSEAYRAATRLDVYANAFEVSDSDNCEGVALALTQEPAAAGVSIAVSGNEFLLVGTGTWYGAGGVAISSQGVSNAVVKDNRIAEAAPIRWGARIQVEAGSMEEATGWTIDSNRGFAEQPDWADIFLGENVRKTVVGPGQNAVVIDYGLDNTVLPQ